MRPCRPVGNHLWRDDAMVEIPGTKAGRSARKPDRVLVVADIEGSSGCWSKNAASFLTREWVKACVEMTKDVDAVSKSLFDAGVKKVYVKDFHRTGYNLIAENMDPRIDLVSGYKRGKVPGIGSPPDTPVVMFIGMHAASGSSGFLPHTLTSRVAKLTVNGEICSEVELFSASLAPFGIRPVFFSGCPVACRQAKRAISGIDFFPIDKSAGPDSFDSDKWRRGLCESAKAALSNTKTGPYFPIGPFKAVATFRDGKKAAAKIAERWNFRQVGRDIVLEADDMNTLYMDLIRMCYLAPAIERLIPAGLLRFYNLVGKTGLKWGSRRYSSFSS